MRGGTTSSPRCATRRPRSRRVARLSPLPRVAPVAPPTLLTPLLPLSPLAPRPSADRPRGAAQALDAWLPPKSGLRNRIEQIHAAHPNGFVREPAAPGTSAESDGEKNGDMALAELALKRHQTLRRAKLKLRFTLKLAQMGRESAKRLAAAGDGATAEAEGDVEAAGGGAAESGRGRAMAEAEAPRAGDGAKVEAPGAGGEATAEAPATAPVS